MQKRYTTTGNQTAATNASLISLMSNTTILPTITDVIVGNISAPTDNSYRLQLGFITADGTNTAVTPTPDSAHYPASQCTAGSNHTVEPTYTAGSVWLDYGVNYGNTFRWVVPEEEGITLENLATRGAGLKTVSVSGAGIELYGTIKHSE